MKFVLPEKQPVKPLVNVLLQTPNGPTLFTLLWKFTGHPKKTAVHDSSLAIGSFKVEKAMHFLIV